MPGARSRPDWTQERRLRRLGFQRIAGIDEAGRGSLAGPVIAAAVVFPPGRAPDGVDDSKRLAPARRERLLNEVLRCAVAWGIGSASAGEIDELNVLNATREAMRRAIESIAPPPDHLLIDAVRIPGVAIPQAPLVGGDRLSVSIAAASIVAKVVRDRLMGYYDRVFPGFGFSSHRGYGTAAHLKRLALEGACPIHRRTFRGVWIQPRLELPPGRRPAVRRTR